jgi:hypothetical protein
MLTALLLTALISPAHARQAVPCDPDEKNAAKISCRCIRARKKSTIYVHGKRLPYTNTIGLCSDAARPELVWFPAKHEVHCPVVDCHEPEDP